MNLNNTMQAIEFYRKAIKLNPKSSDSFYSLGIALKKLYEEDVIRQSLRKAKESNS